MACSTNSGTPNGRGTDSQSGDCLYHQFTAVANFTSQIDFASWHWKAIGHAAAQQCTDKNPDPATPPKYTCAQQASFGKCDGGPNGTNPWMLGMCCKTCHPTSNEFCKRCSAQANGGGPSHAAVGLSLGARAYGMIGQPLQQQEGDHTQGAIAVLWIQNQNSTFSLQNASLPQSQRPALNVITGLKIDMWQFLPVLGSFEVSFINTSSGATVKGASSKLTCPTLCTLDVPGFRSDLAVIVRQQ